MMLLVERLVIGSGAGPSGSFLTSLPVSGVSATDDSSAGKSFQHSAVSKPASRIRVTFNNLDRRFATKLFQALAESRPLKASDVEPGCDPDVLDVNRSRSRRI